MHRRAIQDQLIELHPPELRRGFNDVLLECIDETLTALFSRQVVDALYFHLRTAHSISKDKVPYRLETLSSMLERVIGPSSSRTICKAIAKKLYAKLDLTFYTNPGQTLLEYTEEARKIFQEPTGRQ